MVVTVYYGGRVQVRGLVGNVGQFPETAPVHTQAACQRMTSLPTWPLFCRACAVYVFPSMCRRITCRQTVDRHVSAVAELRATCYYLPPVVAALCFDSCLFSFLTHLFVFTEE